MAHIHINPLKLSTGFWQLPGNADATLAKVKDRLRGGFLQIMWFSSGFSSGVLHIYQS